MQVGLLVKSEHPLTGESQDVCNVCEFGLNNIMALDVTVHNIILHVAMVISATVLTLK